MRALLTVLGCLISGLVFSIIVPSDDVRKDAIYHMESARTGDSCSVCGAPLDESDVAIFLHGRRFPVEKSMVETFLANKETYIRRVQAKSALFQEELDSPGAAAQGGIGLGWFLFGVVILAGLVFGGMSAYLAVSKNLSPIRYFFYGFFFNVFGFCLVLAKPSKAKPGEIPSGLHKVRTTSLPLECPSCGHSNHPAARKCAGCNVDLQPQIQSEIYRAS